LRRGGNRQASAAPQTPSAEAISHHRDAIADHDLIGDLQTAALVTTDGSIDWFCVPHFDSPSVFGALLDDERGGHFRIHQASVGSTSKQMYFPDTAVLVTRFLTEEGLGQVIAPMSRVRRCVSARGRAQPPGGADVSPGTPAPPRSSAVGMGCPAR
jgi:hypothetical protein